MGVKAGMGERVYRREQDALCPLRSLRFFWPISFVVAGGVCRGGDETIYAGRLPIPGELVVIGWSTYHDKIINVLHNNVT